MNRAIVYRLYPTEEQKLLFEKTFGCCRKVYNLMLADKIESYKQTGKFVNVTPAKYKNDYPYLREVDSLALANKQLDLQEAFRNCFSKSRKVNTRFPKFKSKKHCSKSYTTNNQKGSVRLAGNTIRLPKVGCVKAVIHRLPEDDWVIKSVTVSQKSDGKYYASVLFDFDRVVSLQTLDETKSIGFDYSSANLYVDSNGNVGSNHKYYKEGQKKLAKEQRRLSRKQGSAKNSVKSHNYIKQLCKVNKIHRYITNQRLDNLHKISTEIANQYDVVCVEFLNMKSMSNRGFGNGKATLDNGYGIFLDFLEYKLSERGKYFVKVNKWYPSSQLCHCCGYRNKLLKDLSIRKWVCPSCGSHHDRDVNAAKNILQEGLRILNESS